MRHHSIIRIAGLLLLPVGCKPPEKVTPPPAHASATQVAISGAVRLIGAGDIAMCGARGDEETAQLADSVLRADSVAGVQTVVFTTGDNAYPAGLDRDFVRCFTPSWGDPKKRIMKAIRPAIGNHDFQSGRGGAYYRYFGSRAGPAFKGYYSYELGEWHVIALNSELIFNASVYERSQQETWLKSDLRTKSRKCTLAYFHRPLFSSGAHGPSPRMASLYKILAEGGVDLVLAGHDHHYERFLPLNSAGVVDTVNGMQQIIVGTGGGSLTGIRSRVSTGSSVQIQGHFGILIANLGAEGYTTSFLDVEGNVWDPSAGKCH